MGFNLDKIEYEPEQFPGLVYRLDNPKVVVLLFGSGKLIITGGKEPEDAKKAVIKILSDLRSLGLLLIFLFPGHGCNESVPSTGFYEQIFFIRRTIIKIYYLPSLTDNNIAYISLFRYLWYITAEIVDVM